MSETPPTDSPSPEPTDGLYRPDGDGGGPIEFAPAVERRHWRFDPDERGDVYVVGDVHGCIDELRALWAELSPSADDLVVFVGDLVRKGPDSEAVVEFVADRPNAVSVRGNNEDKIVDERIDAEPFASVREEIERYPLVVSWDDAMAVHGGVNPNWPLSEHGPRDLLEMRSVPPGNSYDGPFWFDRYEGPPRVFFGHTVLADPLVRESAVGLDTGCVYGGALTAYEWGSGDLISVPAERTYESRPDRKILDVSD